MTIVQVDLNEERDDKLIALKESMEFASKSEMLIHLLDEVEMPKKGAEIQRPKLQFKK